MRFGDSGGSHAPYASLLPSTSFSSASKKIQPSFVARKFFREISVKLKK
jgi:hypothetical protein